MPYYGQHSVQKPSKMDQSVLQINTGRKLAVSEVNEPSKLALEDLEIQKKIEVLALVEKLGNVSKASHQSGVSRDTIYRHLKLVEQGGPDGLKRHKNCVDMLLTTKSLGN